MTVILPDGPVPLTPHTAKALLAFIRDEYQQRRTVHHSSWPPTTGRRHGGRLALRAEPEVRRTTTVHRAQ
ncbi:hypothetical protein [Streptomyces malaysiensis]|uniref:hypothetical protein n=1 Tax=Streptomyces malaysiensis TaxID=92644 RepID=UPI00114CE07F|nr:hypothetical protein [Streptomyces sp. SPMA113]